MENLLVDDVSTKPVELPAAATSASPVVCAHDRAATDAPTSIVSLVKKPVALDSFVQKPAPEAKPALPRPRPRANEKPAAHSSAVTDRTPELLPKASFAEKLAACSSNTDRTPELLPRVDISRKSATLSHGTNGKPAEPPIEAKPVGGAPRLEGNRLPSPLQTPRSMMVVAPPAVDVQPVKDRLPTEVANPPPPPPMVIVGSAVRKAAEATQLVTPLPPPLVTRVPRAPTPPVIVEPGLAEIETIGATGASARSWIAAGVLSAMAITAVILIVVSGSSGRDVVRAREPVANGPAAATSSKVKPLPAQPAAEPPRPERTARNSEPPLAPEPPRPERTARNSEPPPATEVAARVPAEPPPAKIPAPPRNAITPPTSEATPPKRPSPPPTALASSPPKRANSPSMTHKPVQVAKPVAKAPSRTQSGPPARAIKQPAYDPDALFLKNH